MSDSAGMGPGGGVHDQCVDGDQLRSAEEYLPESDGQGQGTGRRLGQRRRHHHAAAQTHIRYEKRGTKIDKHARLQAPISVLSNRSNKCQNDVLCDIVVFHWRQNVGVFSSPRSLDSGDN